MQKKITEIRSQHSAPEQQVLAALRFVQDDVRYMGIEMGENSHKPNHPNKVFAQRFGDCKDKSYLLCTMLNIMGIEANPVLINTEYKKTITQWLPSAKAFDHVTVRVKLNNKYYWFDPTLSFQRGGIDAISFPDYQYGLIIQDITDGLTVINRKEPGMTSVREIFDISDMSGEAKLMVITHYTGSFADDIRRSFSNNSRYEMQKTFGEYYASYYEQITADSIQYTDDEKTGMFTTKEYYKIADLWELKDGIKKAFFNPYVIDGIIKRPKEAKRKMPFAITWPAKYKEEIEINLPEEWNAEQSFDKVSNASFEMTGRFSFDGRRTISLEYNYENLRGHVEPGDTKEYMNDLDSRDKEFSYVLSYSADGKPLSSSEANTKKSNTNLYIGMQCFWLLAALYGGHRENKFSCHA